MRLEKERGQEIVWTSPDPGISPCLQDAAFALRIAVHEATMFSADRIPAQRLRQAAGALSARLLWIGSGAGYGERDPGLVDDLEGKLLAVARELAEAVSSGEVEAAAASVVLDLLVGLGQELQAVASGAALLAPALPDAS